MTISKVIKTIHIHTDQKFIHDTSRFEGEKFENYIVFIARNAEWKRLDNFAGKNTFYFTYSLKNVHKIIAICEDADLVVLYDLDVVKSKIALLLDKKVRIAWRFFGHELYGIESNIYLSELTKKANALSRVQSIWKDLSHTVSSFKSFLKWGFGSKRIFGDAMNRTNFIMCFCQEEYDFLLKTWGNLPQFIKLSINKAYCPDEGSFIKGKVIIIGNNRSIYNNNLDIINMIETSQNPWKFRFFVLNNYGAESNYTHEVRKAISRREYYTEISDFMSLDDFKKLYQTATAAVFNGYRQMALGNIFTAFKYGVKVYLNETNIIMKWFRNNGLLVYSVDNFYEDLINGEVTLSAADQKQNSINWQKLIKSYTNDDFQNIFSAFFNEKADNFGN